MGLTDVTKAVKNNQGKKGRNSKDIYFSGYDMLGGLIASLIITKAISMAPMIEQKRIKKGILTGHPIQNVGRGIKLDRLVIMAASAALTAGEVFLGWKGGASAGAGMIIGYTYLQSSKHGKYIGQAKE
jgi:hypothetical protein